jgi:signal transduction histidine kinase
LWRNGIDALDRIRDIEGGIDLADIEIIPNPKQGITKAWNMIISAREEVSIMFSSPNALRRQIDMGGLQLLKNASEGRGVKVRLLIPSHSDEHNLSTMLGEIKLQCPQLSLRGMEKGLHTRITIVLADRKECIITELKDDKRDISYNAAGLSTYSKSKSIVSSYVSIFESLWKQTELYEQLKVNEKMQMEFINVAAHELRTPIQPILGLSEVLLNKDGNIEQYHELLNTISRNAKRLQKLTENILDVSRIESQTLNLHKERVNINEKIRNVVKDIESQIHNPKLRIAFLESKDPIYVKADKTRLYQVIANLLGNAIKFTKQGSISVSVDVNANNNELVISVKDTGEGIHSDILPRLFTKFATRSEVGTGLGLFISKSIVGAHGGKMWAKNNSDGKGATFHFTLPLV